MRSDYVNDLVRGCRRGQALAVARAKENDRGASIPASAFQARRGKPSLLWQPVAPLTRWHRDIFRLTELAINRVLPSPLILSPSLLARSQGRFSSSHFNRFVDSIIPANQVRQYGITWLSVALTRPAHRRERRLDIQSSLA